MRNIFTVWLAEMTGRFRKHMLNPNKIPRALSKWKTKKFLKGEVRRKMNFTYVLGFVVLRDVVKSFRSVLLRLRERRPEGIEHEVTRGHDAAQRRNGISNCLFRVRHISSDNYLSKSEQQLPSSSSTLYSSDSSGAWISSHFRIQVRSADECVAPGRRQFRDTRWTSDGRLSSPETNLKVGLLPLFFMQLLLSHMFLSFMVRTSPLSPQFWNKKKKVKNKDFGPERTWTGDPRLTLVYPSHKTLGQRPRVLCSVSIRHRNFELGYYCINTKNYWK